MNVCTCIKYGDFFCSKEKSCASKTSKSISSASKQVCKNFPTGISDKSSIIHVRSYVLRFLSMSVITKHSNRPVLYRICR